MDAMRIGGIQVSHSIDCLIGNASFTAPAALVAEPFCTSAAPPALPLACPVAQLYSSMSPRADRLVFSTSLL